MTPDWKNALASAFRSPDALLAALGMPLSTSVLLRSPFSMLCTQHYAAKMKPCWSDPLLRQVLPVNDELCSKDGFCDDPVGDSLACVEPGILHKYQGRLLLVTTGACAVHCRFCFRRNYPYGQNSQLDIADRLHTRLKVDPSIEEVILSGGDPLLLSNAALAELFSSCGDTIRVRVHTRVPIMLPSRFDDELFALFASLSNRLVLVLHCNHPQELDSFCSNICTRLRAGGATLLNQSVLLRDVNDNAAVLSQLSEALFRMGVLPYYLHQLDRVRGATHFEVPESAARSLMAELRRCLPGYLVPRWVREEAGEPSKTPLT